MLVSTKMRKPSETSRSGLLAIFRLLDELLNPGMISDGERGERVIYNTTGSLAATRVKTLEPQSYNFFHLFLLLREPTQQSIRHTYFEFFHRENLPPFAEVVIKIKLARPQLSCKCGSRGIAMPLGRQGLSLNSKMIGMPTDSSNEPQVGESARGL